MTSKGGYATPKKGSDRFYNPPGRRNQKTLLEKQRLRMKEVEQQESSSDATAESLSSVDVSSRGAALHVPRSFVKDSTAIVTNLDRFIEAVIPFVEARHSPKASMRQQRSRDLMSAPFFYLEDLWESFSAWSAYGTGVPLLLHEGEPVEQFYVPFLSGIQLYMDKSNPTSQTLRQNVELPRLSTNNDGSSNSEGDKLEKSTLNVNVQQLNGLYSTGNSSNDGDGDNSPGVPFFEYLEQEQPYNRKPFSENISLLESQFPELNKIRSSDLNPCSWICIAWYPIYRIPIGPTLQEIEGSFLTFHLLSTQPRVNQPALFHGPNTRTIHGTLDPIPRISLPVFALASYKLKGSLVCPSKPHECEQEESLLQAADKWLKTMHVTLPDYQFFRGHSSQRR